MSKGDFRARFALWNLFKDLGPGSRAIVHSGSHLFGMNWVSQIIAVGYVLVLARALGPDAYSVLAYATMLLLLAQTLSLFGLGALVPLRLAERGASVDAALGLTLAVRFYLLAVSAFVVAVCILALETDSTARWVVLALIPAMVARGVSHWGLIAFIGVHKTGAVSGLSVIFRLTEALVGAALVLSGFGLVGAIVAHSVVSVCEALVVFRLVRRKITPFRLDFSPRNALGLLRDATALAAAGAFVNFLMIAPAPVFRSVADRIELVGQLSLPLQATTMVFTSGAAFLSAALPILKQSIDSEDGKSAVYVETTSRFGIALGFVAGIWGVCLGPWLFNFVLGDGFEIAGELLGLCLVLIVPFLGATAVPQVLAAAECRSSIAYCGFAAATSFLVTAPIGWRFFGLEGFVVGLLVSWSLWAVLLWRSADRQLELKPSRAMAETFVIGTLAFAGSFVVGDHTEWPGSLLYPPVASLVVASVALRHGLGFSRPKV